MKIARFIYKKDEHWGLVDHHSVSLLKAAPFGPKKLTKTKLPLAKVKLLSPVSPSKVVLVGLNYKDHARELKMRLPVRPLIFLKPSTAVIGPGKDIIYPRGVKRLDYEAELAVVIGKQAKCISEQKAAQYILGYTCLNDVTARDLQRKDIQWTRAKSFDSFCPLGPWIQTRINPENLKIRSYLNGRLKQDSSTANLIFSVRELVCFVSQIMTLFPGDVVSTGTPAGVGPANRGDLIEVEIAGIGKLANRVV